MFGITDKDSLIAFCQNTVHIHREYLDFESFWDDRPNFSLDELTAQAVSGFQRLSDFARQFQPIVGRRGFLAWDISETLGYLRSACACELITMEEYQELSQYWVEQAAAFHSWDEYAVDLACGAAYWAFRIGGEQDAVSYRDLNLRLVRDLLGSKQAWCGRMWPRPTGKSYKLSEPEMRPLLKNWDGPAACLATDEITVSGKPVGYCYREKPEREGQDSGWRFLPLWRARSISATPPTSESTPSIPSAITTPTLSPCSAPPTAVPLPGVRTEPSTMNPSIPKIPIRKDESP